MQDILTEAGLQVADALIKVLVAAITLIVVPKLNALLAAKKKEAEAKIGVENFAKAQMLVFEAVKFAEKQFGQQIGQYGEQKKAQVVAYLQKHGIEGIDLEDIDMLIENAHNAISGDTSKTKTINSVEEKPLG